MGSPGAGGQGPSVLELDMKELENAIEHLERSNCELAAFLEAEGPDEDLSQAVQENLAALDAKKARLDKLKDLLDEAQSGAEATDAAAAAAGPLGTPAEPAIGDGAGKTPVVLTHAADSSPTVSAADSGGSEVTSSAEADPEASVAPSPASREGRNLPPPQEEEEQQQHQVGQQENEQLQHGPEQQQQKEAKQQKPKISEASSGTRAGSDAKPSAHPGLIL